MASKKGTKKGAAKSAASAKRWEVHGTASFGYVIPVEAGSAEEAERKVREELDVQTLQDFAVEDGDIDVDDAVELEPEEG